MNMTNRCLSCVFENNLCSNAIKHFAWSWESPGIFFEGNLNKVNLNNKPARFGEKSVIDKIPFAEFFFSERNFELDNSSIFQNFIVESSKSENLVTLQNCEWDRLPFTKREGLRSIQPRVVS